MTSNTNLFLLLFGMTAYAVVLSILAVAGLEDVRTEIDDIKHELETHYKAPVTHLLPDAFGEESTIGTWYIDKSLRWTYVPIIVTEDLAELCPSDNHLANGCITEYRNRVTMVIKEFGIFAEQGCTVEIHEYYHLLGYEETEIPYCSLVTEFRT